jgi:seryl-tRNA synthetase
MLDISFIRQNTDRVRQSAKAKGVDVDIDKLLSLDEARRELIGRVEAKRQERNDLADSLKSGAPSADQIEQGKTLKLAVAELESELEKVETEYHTILLSVPNVHTEDTPVGSSEDENVELKKVGEIPSFDFAVKDHMEIGIAKDWIDKERASKVSGARFAYLKGDLVVLQFALFQFAMSVLTDENTLKKIADGAGLEVSTKPFVPALPPMMMRTKPYEASARLKPDDVTFKLANDDLWLIGSAEHSLCAYFMNETLPEAELPVRFAGYSTSFRREVGSAGQDTAGILRMHHFDKVEMESFTTAETSRDEHEFMIVIQEYLMQQLGVAYRVLLKCTFDVGGPNLRGVDIESWVPSQNVYRETHSADFIGDYQARGLKTKYQKSDGEKEFAHTNDATAFAMGRTLIAIIENYQTAEGDVVVPEVLRPFMAGKEKI